MKLNNAPTQLPLPFAYAGEANVIPDTTAAPDAVSWNLGFPPATLTPIEAGGSAPDGKDMNGSMKALSQLTRWFALGGKFKYNSSFATNGAVSGYPKGAVVLGNGGNLLWRSLVDDNTQDPNSANQTQWSSVKAENTVQIATTGGPTQLTVTQSAATVLFITGNLTTDAVITLPTVVPLAPVDMIVFNATNGAANVYVGNISIGTTGDSSRITSVVGVGATSPNPYVHDQSVLAAVRCTGGANALQYYNGGLWDTTSSNSTLFRIIPAATNTSNTVTIQINGGGVYNIVNNDGTPLPVGALQAGQSTVLLKQGSVMRFLFQAGGGGGATGGGVDKIFYQNGQTVTTSYAIPNGLNAMTAGPVTVAPGVNVTIPTGSRWTVV